jgi:hypothetical protein
MGASSLLFSQGVQVAGARGHTACAAFPQADCEQRERGRDHAAMINPHVIKRMQKNPVGWYQHSTGNSTLEGVSSNVYNYCTRKHVKSQTIHRG